jgi:hypothetical protein
MGSLKGRPCGVDRALRTLGEATTAELKEWCYRDRGRDLFTRMNRSRCVRRVCERMAIKVSRLASRQCLPPQSGLSVCLYAQTMKLRKSKD